MVLVMATEERIICCCGAATWARVIAILQIVLNAIGALLMILALAVGSNVTPEEKEGANIKGSVLAVIILGLVMSTVGVVFGVILLLGVNQRRPTYLKAWMIFTVIMTVWGVVEALFGNGTIGVRIFQCVIEILINGFGIWVVWVLNTEITNGSGQAF